MDRDKITRVLTGVASPMGLLLAILFFVPWLEVSCGPMKMATMSGYQLATGDATPAASPMTDEDQMSDQGQPSDGVEIGPDSTQDKQDPDSRPWFLLGLAAPLIILAVGLAGALRNVSSVPGILVACGVLGIILMIAAANVSFDDEITKSAKAKPQDVPEGVMVMEPPPEMVKQIAAQVKVEGMAALWFSLTLYVLVLLAGVGALVARAMVRPKPQPQPLFQTPPAPQEWPGGPDQYNP